MERHSRKPTSSFPCLAVRYCRIRLIVHFEPESINEKNLFYSSSYLYQDHNLVQFFVQHCWLYEHLNENQLKFDSFVQTMTYKCLQYYLLYIAYQINVQKLHDKAILVMDCTKTIFESPIIHKNEVYRCDQHIRSNVEFLSTDQIWIINIFLYLRKFTF